MSRKKLFAAGAGITLGVLGVFAYPRYMNARDKLLFRKIFKPVATSSQRIQGVKLDAAQIKSLPLYPVENITVPTLVVHSTTDPQVPFDGTNWIATTIPDATLLKVEGGGHLCFVVYKEQVVPQIVDFLEGTAPDELK